MTKATRILNEYHIKQLILKGNPQYENFYKEELIEFCKISKQEIERLNNIIDELEKYCIFISNMETNKIDKYALKININDREDFLFRDYGIDIKDGLKINKLREIRKVRCIETNKVFKSPVSAGRYYGFENGDMISKVCRHARETAKGLHFEYIEK